jgi:hypothetical protein
VGYVEEEELHFYWSYLSCVPYGKLLVLCHYVLLPHPDQGVTLLMLTNRFTPTYRRLVSSSDKMGGATYHPVATLIGPLTLDVHLQSGSSIVVLRLQGIRKLIEPLDGIRFHQLLVIQMIKKNIESLLGILDLGSK